MGSPERHGEEGAEGLGLQYSSSLIEIIDGSLVDNSIVDNTSCRIFMQREEEGMQKWE